MATFENITLISNDSVSFIAPASITTVSVVINDIVEDIGAESPLVLPNVKSSELKKIVEYHVYHACADYVGMLDVKTWDREFVDMPMNDLLNLLYAANYLNIKTLITLCCEAVAKHINGRSADYIRETFDIKDECTPEQAEELRLEREWAFSLP